MSSDSHGQKIDKLLENMTEIKVTLAKHEILHEKTTVILENHIEKEDEILQRIKELEQVDLLMHREFQKEIEPFKQKMAMLKGAIWVISIASGILYGLYQIFTIFFKIK